MSHELYVTSYGCESYALGSICPHGAVPGRKMLLLFLKTPISSTVELKLDEIG